MIRSKTYIATPPGATIKEQLLDRGMTQKEFAIRLDVSEKHLSKLINGDVCLTPEMAIKLETVLNIPASFWNNLESLYREKILKAQDEIQMEEDIEIAKKLPYAALVKLNWIEKVTRIEEKVVNLRKYFEVSKLTLLSNASLNKVAFRRISITDKADCALLAWIQQAKVRARNIHTEKININLLKENLNTIKKMSIQNPDDFCEDLITLLKQCGIALIFLPHLPGSYLHGATFIDQNKIIIGLTVRGKDSDKFWFSFFHEIGHIVLGHINNPEGTCDQDEEDANQFARETLIPSKDFNEFLLNYDITKKSIISFAKHLEICPGILVGRLQKEKYIPYTKFNDLKQKFEIC